jgi:hypothetical protein
MVGTTVLAVAIRGGEQPARGLRGPRKPLSTDLERTAVCAAKEVGTRTGFPRAAITEV